MRLKSIDQFVRGAALSARRFPMVLACAVLAAVAAGLLPESSIDDEILTGLLQVASLGIPLFFAMRLVAERWTRTHATLWTARLVAIAALVALYVARLSWSEPVEMFRYIQLSLAAHLLVAVGPYLGVREWNGFWQYNRSLLLRFLLAAVFSAVLYVGLAVALAAVDNLLGVDVEGDTYFRLWCAIAFVFNTWFFVAGAPDDFASLERRTDYPAVLKVLSQYILSPLVTVYMLIVMLYLGRILITRVWPSGWIGYLVSGVATAGILSLLLLYPIEEREENRWVRGYARWFYIGLIPADVMLLLAIGKRIEQYAITEPRYFLVVLALWLAGVSLFYAISRSRNIKVIPATLAVLALVTFAGPWSAYAVSRRSQTARLEGLLERHEILVEGRARPAPGDVPAEDRREISAVISYLARNHGTGSIEPWFPEGRLAEVDTIARGIRPTERWQSEERAALIAAELGIEYVGRWMPGDGAVFDFHVEPAGPPLRISGYDYALGNRAAFGDTVRVEDPPCEFRFDEEELAIVMLVDGEERIRLPVTPLIERAREYTRSRGASPQIPAALMTLEGEADGDRLVVAVAAIRGFIEEPASGTGDESEGYRLTSLSADYYFSIGP